MQAVSFDWADGTYTFHLPLGQVRELQEKAGIGPLALLNRIRTGQFMIDDLREVLRLGLIGGGKAPKDAVALVRRYVDERPLLESVEPCVRVLVALLSGGPADDPAGKPPAAGGVNGATASSPSPQSTVSVAPSGSARARSIN